MVKMLLFFTAVVSLLGVHAFAKEDNSGCPSTDFSVSGSFLKFDQDSGLVVEVFTGVSAYPLDVDQNSLAFPVCKQGSFLLHPYSETTPEGTFCLYSFVSGTCSE